MSKRQTRKHRTRGENGDKLLGLKKALADLERFSDTLVDKFAARAVSQLGKNISYKIVMSGAGARLSRFDDKAYEVYAALMGHYKHIAELYDQHRGALPQDRTREIADGIISIILSRLKFAEENGGTPSENPVNAEKNRLVSALLQEFYKECKSVPKDDFYGDIHALKMRHRRTLALAFGSESARALFGETLNHIDKLSRPIHPIYCKKCQSLVSALNDLNLRTSASYYFRQLETEKDIIESIVKIQISALELQLSRKQGQTDEPQSALGELLRTIRETYQLFMKDAEQILEDLHHLQDEDHRANPIADSFDNYQADLAAKLCCDQCFPTSVFEQASAELPALLNTYELEAHKALQIVIDRKIAKQRLDHTLYELRKNVTQSTLMADEMAAVFRKAHEFYTEHEQPLNAEPGAEIINGINETTVIKIMNILDGKQSFSDETLQRLLKLRDEGRGICDTLFESIRADITARLPEAFFADPSGNISDILERTFDTALEQNFAQKLDKTTSAWQSEINKQILTFKREVLLYEMGTFDEIMNFSVTKLVEGSGEAASSSLSYAIHLRRAQADLVEILGRNGITRILPQPHDPFDGKEHDVLMAERTEGFAKGEIIKTFSSGYKERDVVLVRASVIAAK